MSDVIRKVTELKKLYDQINSWRKAGKEVVRSFEACERAARTGLLTGDDEATIMADAIARRFQDLLRESARWDENAWIAQTSYNALNPATYGPAIEDLKRDRQRFLELRDAFVALAQLLQIKRIADHLDVKKLAKALVPSLIMLDEIHRQDVIVRFRSLASITEQTIRRLDNVLKAVGGPGVPAIAPAGFNFLTLSPGLTLVTRVPLLRRRIWAFPAFCRLTADVPKGTEFGVRSIQTVEKWFDVEAKNYVGLKLRCSAAEGAAIFTSV